MFYWFHIDSSLIKNELNSTDKSTFNPTLAKSSRFWIELNFLFECWKKQPISTVTIDSLRLGLRNANQFIKFQPESMEGPSWNPDQRQKNWLVSSAERSLWRGWLLKNERGYTETCLTLMLRSCYGWMRKQTWARDQERSSRACNRDRTAACRWQRRCIPRWLRQKSNLPARPVKRE